MKKYQSAIDTIEKRTEQLSPDDRAVIVALTNARSLKNGKHKGSTPIQDCPWHLKATKAED
jgi:hypothetical protein